MSAPTPRPWRHEFTTDSEVNILGNGPDRDYVLAFLGYALDTEGEAISNAELIVQAVNAHDQLIAALTDAHDALGELLNSPTVAIDWPDLANYLGSDCASGLKERIDAALALAKGGA